MDQPRLVRVDQIATIKASVATSIAAVTMRMFLTRSQALAFCERSEATVAAGRPLCQFCGLPIDPDGHPCPRMN